MAKKPRAIVLDSWAIMAYLEDEPAAERIADIIADANEDNTPLLMTVVNFGEVWYIIAREASESDAERSIVEIKHLGVEIVDADWSLAREAAGFKSKHKMSYADCFAAALAKQKKAPLVTGDHEFKQLESQIEIIWLK
jgi:predicted nucleic acid-binding protein